MAQMPGTSSDRIRQIFAQILRAYEGDRGSHFQLTRDAQNGLQVTQQTLQQNGQAEISAAYAEYKTEETGQVNRQKQASEVLTSIHKVEQSALYLLKNAGVIEVHPLASQLVADISCLDVDASDRAIENARFSIQAAYAAMETTLLRGAETLLNQGEWDKTRQIIRPVLENRSSPVYADALALTCETYYRPAKSFLNAQEWLRARTDLETLHGITSQYRDAPELLREAYLQPARQSLAAQQWEDAQSLLVTWRRTHPDDPEARELLCQSYYIPSRAALHNGNWQVAREGFKRVREIDREYRGHFNLLREAYLRPARQAISEKRWESAREDVWLWQSQDSNDPDARILLCQSYYLPAVQALDSKNWDTAQAGFRAVLEIDAGFQDAALLLRECYLRPARQALSDKRWLAAQSIAQNWYDEHPADAEIRALLCEAHYVQAKLAIQTRDWRIAGSHLQRLVSVNPNYRDTATWAKTYPLLPWYSGQFHQVGCLSFPKELPIGNIIDIHFDNEGYLRLMGDQILPHERRLNIIRMPLETIVRHQQTQGHWTRDDEAAVRQGISITIGRNATKRNILYSVGSGGFTLASTTFDYSKNHQIKCYDMHTLTEVGQLNVRFSRMMAPRLSASPGQKKHIIAFSATSKSEVSFLGRLLNSFLDSFLGPLQDISNLSDSTVIKLWNLSDGAITTLPTYQPNNISALAFSSNGKVLASEQINGPIKIWDIERGVLIHTFFGAQGSVEPNISLKFSPDGNILARSGGYNEMGIQLWDVQTGKLIRLLAKEKGIITTDLVFDPTGNLLATLVPGLMIWDVSSGERVLGAYSYGSSSFLRAEDFSLAFSPDGQFVVTAWRDRILVYRAGSV